MGFIFWTGKGWLVPAVTFGVCLVAEIVSETLAGNDDYYQTHGFPLAIALWISAAINGAVAWQYYSPLLSSPPPKKKKRKRSSRKRTPGWIDHSFMFVNHVVWVAILVACGFASLISLGF